MARRRPYVKIDQSIGDHPRSLRLSPKHYLAAIGLHVVAIGFCDRMRTDGFVPSAILPKMTMGPYKAAVQELLRVGFWEEADDGYMIHDYLDWQDSAVALEEKSKAARDSVRRRWNQSSDTERTTDGNTTEPSRAEPSHTEPRESAAHSAFDECWEAYPVHRYKTGAIKAFEAAVAAGADPSEIVAACRRVKSTEQSLTYFIADGTWRDHIPKPKAKKAPSCDACGGSRWVLPRDSEVAVPCSKCSESKAEVR